MNTAILYWRGRVPLFDEDRSFINVMAANSEILNDIVITKGLRGFIADLKLACSGLILDKTRIKDVVSNKCQWKLVS